MTQTSYHNAGEWLINLNKKFFSPVVEIVKGFHYIYIINKDTAVCTTVESHTKTLKPLLTSSIPNLHAWWKQLNLRLLIFFHDLQTDQRMNPLVKKNRVKNTIKYSFLSNRKCQTLDPTIIRYHSQWEGQNKTVFEKTEYKN